jgi:hypothetical protein
VFSPTGGTQTAGTPITVTTATPGATIHYTVNGVDPTESDPTITSGATVIAGTYILKARAWKAGATTSAVTSAAFTVTDATTSALLASGSHHALARRADGVVFAWGKNSYGQLGDLTTTRRTLPTLVAGLTGVVALAGGQEHSLAAQRRHGLGVGSNGYGVSATDDHRTSPADGGDGGLTNVTQVAAGDAHSLARRADGTVWAVTRAASSATAPRRCAPRRTGAAVDIVWVAAAAVPVALRGWDGWAWGANGSGQWAMARRRRDESRAGRYADHRHAHAAGAGFSSRA